MKINDIKMLKSTSSDLIVYVIFKMHLAAVWHYRVILTLVFSLKLTYLSAIVDSGRHNLMS